MRPVTKAEICPGVRRNNGGAVCSMLPVVAAGLAHRPALLGREGPAADAQPGRPTLGAAAAAALSVGQSTGFRNERRSALGSRSCVTGAVGSKTPFGAMPALGPFRERRDPAALDADAGGPALGVLAAVALTVGAAPGLGIARRLALGPEPRGAGTLGGPGLLAAGRADAAVRHGRAVAALDAQAALPAFGNAPMVAVQVAPPPPVLPLVDVALSHGGPLPADAETDGRTPRRLPRPPRRGRWAGRTSGKGAVSPSACGRGKVRRRCRPRSAPRPGS